MHQMQQQRTACFGTCTVYTLAIKNDGSVVYEGKEFVKVKGRAEATISKEKIGELISEFWKIDYFSLQVTCPPKGYHFLS